MVTSVSLAKNYEEVQRLLEILSKCNMWASGTRIENLPPSHVEKIEVQVVQKNYLELSEVGHFHPVFLSLYSHLDCLENRVDTRYHDPCRLSDRWLGICQPTSVPKSRGV